MNVNTGRNTAAVVFAAGRGARMKTDVPKVLLELGGKPIIQYIVCTLQSLGVYEIIVVVGYQAEAVCQVVNNVADQNLHFVVQEPLLGTGDALRVACPVFSEPITDVLAVNGDDSIFYKVKTLDGLIAFHCESQNTITLMAARVDQSVAFKRIISNLAGKIEFLDRQTMAERDLTSELVPTGAYVFERRWLVENIQKNPRNFDVEFPIYELVNKAQLQGRPVKFRLLENKSEWKSINTSEDLHAANELYSQYVKGVNINDKR